MGSAVDVGIAVQADWENREFISNISLNVRRLFDFLLRFEATTKSKLAALNEKLDSLERKLEVLEVQAHRRLTAEERDRVCAVEDCRKLTVEACTHAAQNERHSLCVVLQVLFFEQLQLWRAITGTLLASADAPHRLTE
ncbi:hypothetical protein ACQ4PT_049995 [Festuca glaucescens]